MMKERFLREIQQQACRPNSLAEKVWEVAVKADEKDARWHAVEEHDYVGTFAIAFGMVVPQANHTNKSRLIEKAEKDLARAVQRYEFVKENKPQFEESALSAVKFQEANLKKLREAE